MTSISRRDFIKLGALSLGSLAFTPFLPELGEFESRNLARVTVDRVSIYKEPSDESPIVGQWYRDDLVHIYGEVVAERPSYNPVWYRVWGGYMHRARLQRVGIHLNPVQPVIPESGQLAEVTVPFSQSYRYLKYDERWIPLYRLYSGTTHWALALETGPDGKAWYRLRHGAYRDIHYHVPAEHLHLYTPDELAPISPEIPHSQKRIEVDLTRQQVTAFENGLAIFQTTISSGIPSGSNTDSGIPTTTPDGNFSVLNKMPSAHMGDGNLASDLEAYELPGVPWNCYFTQLGHAFHGTYWHDNFGVPMSHGCINMRTEDARWLFRWTRPVIDPDEREQFGTGTAISIYY
ncbi:MAG: L,D-transpeptidase [Chloroflexi bacterium]|nr:L,D-transpeptidase [Chloroflexota bacterium]